MGRALRSRNPRISSCEREQHVPCMRRLDLLAARAALLLVAAIVPATAQTAIDGNRFRMDGTTWRLWAIDAPDPSQTCRRNWPAGAEAVQALTALLQAGEVRCEEKGRNQEGEEIAICRSGEEDIAAAMVRSGMAWADMAVDRKYVVEEARAASEYIGVHAHRCKTAWDWRAGNRVEPQFNRQEGYRGISRPTF